MPTAPRKRGTRKATAADLPAVPASAQLASIDELVEDAQKTLNQIMLREDGSREDYVRLAHDLINLRRHFTSPGKDFPDWRGRSQQYRDAAARVYAAADIPPDSEGSVQARIRYIVGDELRKVAPLEQLDALNYRRGTGAERAKERRRGKVLDTEGPTLQDVGQAPITTRAQAFRAVRQVVEQVVWQLPIPEEQDEDAYVELMSELVETAKLFEQLWALHEKRRSARRHTIEVASTFAATQARRPATPEEAAAIRLQASQEARFLSAPQPELEGVTQ